jgi:ubiquinone biosynthesis protein UbiJ
VSDNAGADDRAETDSASDRDRAGLRGFAALLADGLAEFANATLDLDPAGAARLAALDGIRVLIRTPAPTLAPATSGERAGSPAELIFSLKVSGDRLRFFYGPIDAPDVIVTGSPTVLIGWALSRGRNRAPGLRIDGDSQRLDALAEIVRNFTPDLARPLGRLLGPDSASQLLGAAELAFAGLRSVIEGAGAGLKQGSAQWFATREGLQAFLDELDSLRIEVDRLAARVAAAEDRATPAPTAGNDAGQATGLPGAATDKADDARP